MPIEANKTILVLDDEEEMPIFVKTELQDDYKVLHFATVRAYLLTLHSFQCTKIRQLQHSGSGICPRCTLDVSLMLGLPLGVCDQRLEAASTLFILRGERSS